jgi:hypothetical protein
MQKAGWGRGPILAPLLSCHSGGRLMLGEPDSDMRILLPYLSITTGMAG